jgi:hypothetical protein
MYQLNYTSQRVTYHQLHRRHVTIRVPQDSRLLWMAVTLTTLIFPFILWHSHSAQYKHFHILHQDCIQYKPWRRIDHYNLVFCWPCIAIYACNETNLMHCLSSVYSVTTPLHVSGLLVAHHQEVTMYICVWQLVRVVLLRGLFNITRLYTCHYKM